MNNRSVSWAIAAALTVASVPSWSQSQDLDSLKAQIEALQSKVEALEQSQDRATDAVAQTKAGMGDWVSRFTWKGDLRYRHELVDAEESSSDRHRHRVRARFGFAAKINDTVTGTVQLATQGDDRDPRSTNQTLGEGFTRKGVGIDLAYLDWKPVEGFNVMLGKMPQPWQKTGSYFWDNDVTPEGVAFKIAQGAFFATAFHYWLSERSSASDATLTGGQLGLTGQVGNAKVTGAVGYFDAGAVRGQQVAQPDGCADGFNNAFFGGSQGNTTVTVDGCPFLANDFNLLQGFVQAEFKLGELPLVVFADYLQNQEADDLETATAIGFVLGKASNPGTWELNLQNQSIEKDSQFGQFVDSDFGGGLTDTDGFVLKVGYAPAKNWVLNGTWFKNERFLDAPGAIKSDYDRVQLDLNYKF
jgi:hypothetical protein